jgi:hypothetical protein
MQAISHEMPIKNELTCMRAAVVDVVMKLTYQQNVCEMVAQQIYWCGLCNNAMIFTSIQIELSQICVCL